MVLSNTFIFIYPFRYPSTFIKPSAEKKLWQFTLSFNTGCWILTIIPHKIVTFFFSRYEIIVCWCVYLIVSLIVCLCLPVFCCFTFVFFQRTKHNLCFCIFVFLHFRSCVCVCSPIMPHLAGSVLTQTTDGGLMNAWLIQVIHMKRYHKHKWWYEKIKDIISTSDDMKRPSFKKLWGHLDIMCKCDDVKGHWKRLCSLWGKVTIEKNPVHLTLL